MRLLSKQAFLHVLLVARVVFSQEPLSCKDKPAIVVGAGISGISAARELAARGCRVTILEGSDRKGGRMQSDYTTFGEPIDLCGGFIHSDSLRNSIMWLTTEFDIETYVSGGSSAFRGEEVAKWVRSNGVELTEDEIDKGYDLLDRWYDTEAWNLALACEDSPLSDTALNFVSLQAKEIMRTGNGNTATIDSTFDEDILDFHLTNYFDRDWGLSPWQHSVKGFSVDWDWLEYPGVDRNIPSGVQTVIQALEDDINDQYPGMVDFVYNSIVTKVSYNDTGCYLDTEDGSTYNTGACLITIPVAIMKDQPDLFDPPLPNDKAIVIDRIGIGGLNKIFVKWNEIYWNVTHPSYYIVSGDKNNPVSDGFHSGQLYGREDSHVTQHFFGGDNFAFGSENNINAAKDAVVEVMQGIFPGAGISKNDIEEISITSHREDPFKRGSYSAPRVYFNGKADREILARPIGSTLFFAGEHTNTEGRYQTMDGAYDSGIRAAAELAAAPQNVVAAVSQSAVHNNPNQPGNPNLRHLKAQGPASKKPNGPVFPGHGLSQATMNSGKFRNKFKK